MSDRKREHEADSNEVKRYRREEIEEEQDESDNSDYQPYIPLKERRKEKADEAPPNLQESRWLKIQQTIQSLEHACQCKVSDCCQPDCKEMRKIVEHAIWCRNTINFFCQTCQRLISLVNVHVKTCQASECLLPYCLTIKYESRKSGINPTELPQNMSSNTGSPQSTESILDNMLETFKSSNFSSHQKEHILSLLKSNPELMDAFLNPRTHYRQQMDEHNILEQQQNPRSSKKFPKMLTNTRILATLDNLLTNLRASNFSSHQREYTLSLLKSNPELMAAFLKQRAQQQQQTDEKQNILE